jgi:hypothetical protein
MLKRQTLFTTTLAALLLAPALALSAPAVSADQWLFVGGEQGWAYEPTPLSTKTRAQVQAEAATARDDDAWRYVGGEATWSSATAEYEFRGGTLTHTEKCAFRSQLARSTKGGVLQPLPGYYFGA